MRAVKITRFKIPYLGDKGQIQPAGPHNGLRDPGSRCSQYRQLVALLSWRHPNRYHSISKTASTLSEFASVAARAFEVSYSNLDPDKMAQWARFCI